MPWRGVAPVQLVIALIGAVLLLSVSGMIVLAVVALINNGDVEGAIPNQLATVSVASMTAMAGLLAPNTGLLTSSKSARRAEAAGHAAATAVIEADGQVEDGDGRHRA